MVLFFNPCMRTASRCLFWCHFNAIKLASQMNVIMRRKCSSPSCFSQPRWEFLLEPNRWRHDTESYHRCCFHFLSSSNVLAAVCIFVTVTVSFTVWITCCCWFYESISTRQFSLRLGSLAQGLTDGSGTSQATSGVHCVEISTGYEGISACTIMQNLQWNGTANVFYILGDYNSDVLRSEWKNFVFSNKCSITLY